MVGIQTIVRNRKLGHEGVVVNDSFGVCGDTEILVVYEGSAVGFGTPEEELEVVGPENAVADLKKCGGGRGAECCIFLVVGGDGPECQRFGSLRTGIQFKTGMTAKREPLEKFPDCQLEPGE